jgi:hypothetical protein
MSSGNWFLTRKRAFDLRTITITASYTAKVQGVGDDLVMDRVINVTDPAADVALTLPNGLYEGQRILINFTSDASGKTVTVTPATANTTASYSLTAAGDYCSLEWMNATEGWAYLSEVTT